MRDVNSSVRWAPHTCGCALLLVAMAAVACQKDPAAAPSQQAGTLGQRVASGAGAAGAAHLEGGGTGGAPVGGAGSAGTAVEGGSRAVATSTGGAGSAAGGRSGGTAGIASGGAGAAGAAGRGNDDDAGTAVQASSWVTTWGTTLIATSSSTSVLSGDLSTSFDRVTLRQIVHTSVSGDHLRIRLSNVFGTQAVPIASVHVALRDSGSAIVSASDRQLTFAGAAATMIPVGQILVSDAIAFDVPALGDLAISIEFPQQVARQNTHPVALQTSYVSAPGSSAGATSLPGASTLTEWFYLTGVDVERAPRTAAVVILGASNVDGYKSMVDANHRWSDEVARRLNASAQPMAVVNEGQSGNGILSDLIGPSANKRFERDVLGNSGVTHVLLMQGTNDIMFSSATSDDLIAGTRQLIDKAHKAGLKFCAGTLTPYEGYTLYSANGEKARMGFNEWVRTSHELDGFVDFDPLLRDPNAPTKILAAYDSGDHLHPNDAGYKLMGEMVDLALFR
jgi:lysophospholipase L1-like esterase